VNNCATCNAENQAELEAAALEVMAGSRSWRSLAREFDLTHATGVRNHMERHYTSVRAAGNAVQRSEVEDLTRQTIDELTEQMSRAPAEVKPFYAVAIQNMRGLADTKPSQQHLINALKAIHEVTGMKMEQRLMLQFAQHQFGLGVPEASAALEEHTPIDVDIVDAELVSA
jgi:hypothetical protein